MEVLIAHGDEAVRRELARALAETGDELLEAADGVAALELLLREDGPQLALIDWGLPRLEGPELCRLLRDFTLGRPKYLILVTPAEEDRDVAAGLEAGAHDFVSIPVSEGDLRARVEFARHLVDLPWGQTSLGVESRCTETLPPGIYDRETILRRLDEELARARRDDAPLSIALLQIEGLQAGEQRGGREVRDAMLYESVRRLRASLRPYDGLGRMGYDQFLAIMPKANGPDLAVVLSRLCGVLTSEPLTFCESGYRLSATIGGATASEEGRDELLAAARTSLHAARQEGPDRIVAGPKVELQAVLAQI